MERLFFNSECLLFFYFVFVVELHWIQNKQGLQAIRCPAGLYFDIEKQTCDWKEAVKNCKTKSKERKAIPFLVTTEPLCPDGQLACADKNCIDRGLFCNGEKDCLDGSDENSCGKFAFSYSFILIP